MKAMARKSSAVGDKKKEEEEKLAFSTFHIDFITANRRFMTRSGYDFRRKRFQSTNACFKF